MTVIDHERSSQKRHGDQPVKAVRQPPCNIERDEKAGAQAEHRRNAKADVGMAEYLVEDAGDQEIGQRDLLQGYGERLPNGTHVWHPGSEGREDLIEPE